MDPVTHGIAGALLGKGFFSDREEKVAIFAATLGAVFPDIDIFYEGYRGIRPPRSAGDREIPSLDHAFVRGAAVFRPAARRAYAARRPIPQAPLSALPRSRGAALLAALRDLRRRHREPHPARRHDVVRHAHVVPDFEPPRGMGFALHHRLCVHHDHPRAAGDRLDLPRSREKPQPRGENVDRVHGAAISSYGSLAGAATYPFHFWIAVLASAILAALFFVPARGRLGIQGDARRMVPGWERAARSRIYSSARSRITARCSRSARLPTSITSRSSAWARCRSRRRCSIGATRFARPTASTPRNSICAKRIRRSFISSPIRRWTITSCAP